MKKSILYIVSGVVAMGFAACNDFLKDDSGDLLIPKALADFTPVLYGEGYPRNINSELGYYSLFTDDVEVNELPRDPYFGPNTPGFDTRNGGDGKHAYIWGLDIEEYLPDGNWTGRYKNILGCNTIIEALPGMIYHQSDAGLYNYLAAQAYTLRAYSYFVLVNCYALPWSEANLDEPGVILHLSSDMVVGATPRATVGRVYRQINDDIEKAFEHMALAHISPNIHLISPGALSLLATRVALFQEDWDAVIDEGEDFISKFFRALKDLNTVNEQWLGQTDDDKNGFLMMNASANPEIIFTFGNSSTGYEYLAGGLSSAEVGFRVSYSYDGSLYESYDDDDLRKLAYFNLDFYDPGIPVWGVPAYYEYQFHAPRKYETSASVYNVTYTNYHENWRTVEVWLNVAEAYAHRDGVSARSIELINALRRNRIRTSAFVELTAADFATRDDLLRFIWAERRRELCFEEAMRFWDLRRQGMPEITHVYYSSATESATYVLPQGSPNYVMPIPPSESDYNSGIVQNRREAIVAQ